MFSWQVRDRVVDIAQRPLVMGIVNVTPDSFSDGGQLPTPEAAVLHALELERQGADILDIGGESTRPGALPVPADEELRRVLPVVKMLAGQTRALLSIDTSKASVARACLEAGAHIINDVCGLADADMPEVVRAAGAGAIVMHMQGTPATMQLAPHYDDVVEDILTFLQGRIEALVGQGLTRSSLMIDPGVGFGKTTAHNMAILGNLAEFRRLGLPLCLGVSRKGFLAKVLGRPLHEKNVGSLVAAAFAMAQNGVDVLRVHEVQEHRDLVVMWQALRDAVSGY